jgi:hypothetical protein
MDNPFFLLSTVTGTLVSPRSGPHRALPLSCGPVPRTLKNERLQESRASERQSQLQPLSAFLLRWFMLSDAEHSLSAGAVSRRDTMLATNFGFSRWGLKPSLAVLVALQFAVVIWMLRDGLPRFISGEAGTREAQGIGRSPPCAATATNRSIPTLAAWSSRT